MSIPARPAIDVGDPNCQLDWEWASKQLGALDGRMPVFVGLFRVQAGSGSATVTLPRAGGLLVCFGGSFYVTTPDFGGIEITIDGAFQDTAYMFVNEANSYRTVSSWTALPMTAGAHTIATGASLALTSSRANANSVLWAWGLLL